MAAVPCGSEPTLVRRVVDPDDAASEHDPAALRRLPHLRARIPVRDGHQRRVASPTRLTGEVGGTGTVAHGIEVLLRSDHRRSNRPIWHPVGVTKTRRTADDDQRGLIYVIGDAGARPCPAVKIGITKSEQQLKRRLTYLSRAHARPLIILHREQSDFPRWVEHQLHVVLKPWRSPSVSGREWFDVRSMGEGDWGRFIQRALAGKVRGSDRCPGPANIPGHELLHLTGRQPGTLVSVCSCEWKSDPGSVPKALSAIKDHIEGPRQTR